MSREQDVLFCKIAITNGLVTQEQAQKCLGLCERREKEGKRRPMIGAVFSKYNLMRPDDVQRLYEAVNKRLGQPTGTRPGGSSTIRSNGGSSTARRAGGSSTARRGRPGGGTTLRGVAARRGRPAGAKVDPRTLWTGVGFGLVFVFAISFIIYLYATRGGTTEETRVAGEGSETAATAAMSADSALPGETSAEPSLAEGEEGEEAAAEPKAETIDPQLIGMHKRAINDARGLAFAQLAPEQALKNLDAHYERMKVEYEHGLPDRYRKEVLDLRKDIQEMIAAEKGEGGDEGAPEAP